MMKDFLALLIARNDIKSVMTLQTFLLIVQFQVVLSVLVVLMSVLHFRQKSTETKLIGLTFTFSVIFYFSVGLLQLKGKNVNIPQSISAIFYFLVLTVMYNVALRGRYKKVFLAVAIFFVTFAVSNLLFGQQNDNNTYSKAVRSIILICYCIVYCYRLLVDLPVQHLQRVPMFWFNSAVLIFNAGTLFLFLFTTYLVEVLHNDLLIYWTFHNILNIIQHLVIMIGLWMDLQNIKLRSSLPSVP